MKVQVPGQKSPEKKTSHVNQKTKGVEWRRVERDGKQQNGQVSPQRTGILFITVETVKKKEQGFRTQNIQMKRTVHQPERRICEQDGSHHGSMPVFNEQVKPEICAQSRQYKRQIYI